MDSYIYILNDLVFFFMGVLFLYLFVLTIASHFKHIIYSKTKKKKKHSIWRKRHLNSELKETPA